MIAAIALVFDASLLLVYALNPDREDRDSSARDFPEVGTPDGAYFQEFEAVSFAAARTAVDSLVVPLGLILVAFVATVIIYRSYPALVRRRRGFRALPPEKDPVLVGEIEQLASLAGISLPPAIEIGKDMRSQSGQVFGADMPYVMGLDGGLQLQRRKKANLFRAVVLHELAHIANHDVRRTYVAQALWAAVVISTLAPLVIAAGSLFVQRWVLRPLFEGQAFDPVRFFSTSLPSFSLVAFQVLATLAVVAAIRASLLRAREVYADVRAGQWGAEASLKEILQRSAVGKPRLDPFRLWRLHPTAQQRLTALEDPSSLFHVSLDLPFLTGVLLAFLLTGIIIFVLPLTEAIIHIGGGLVSSLVQEAGATGDIKVALFILDLLIPVAIASLVLPVLGAAYLVAGTVGLQTQQEALADLVTGSGGFLGYGRLMIPAALIALGLEVGFLIAPGGSFSLLSIRLALGYTAHPFLLFVWLIGATALTWLCLLYSRFFGRQVLGSAVGASPPKWSLRILTLAFGVLLWIALLPLVMSRLMFFPLSSYLSSVQMSAWQSALFLTLMLALFVYGMTFTATWLVVRAGQLIQRPRCPSCLQRTRQKYPASRACEHCGAELAPWLFLDPRLLPPPALQEPDTNVISNVT